ncbi:hypothetical protein TNCV_4031481 [Trichonephila clavipes]|nr:hypothetical protein TNCV_4031481 [Trichonephila clavipes]
MNSIQEGVFEQDNVRPHTAVIMQRVLQSVDMSPYLARLPDESPIEHSRSWTRSWRVMSSNLVPQKTRRAEGTDARSLKRPPVGMMWKLGEGVPQSSGVVLVP